MIEFIIIVLNTAKTIQDISFGLMQLNLELLLNQSLRMVMEPFNDT